MKQVLSVIAALCLLAGLGNAAILVDDFESYSLGSAGDVTTAWEGGNSVIETDPADASNKVLRGTQIGGQSSTYCILSPETSIAEGQTKTLFFRFRVNSNTTDTAMGMTNVDAPNTADGQWGIFGPDFRFTNGHLDVRHANTWYTDTGIILNVGETEPWYNLWVVITNAVGSSQATDVFKLYVHQNGDDPATEANRVTVNGGAVNTFGFRVAVADTLDRFLWGRQGGGDENDIRRVWIDDIYMMDGENLTNPAKNLFGAHDPNPANGAEGVELNTILSWSTGLDPVNMEQVNPDITDHRLYLVDTEPNWASPLTITELIGVTGAAGSYTPTNLQPDKTYYWRVDEIVNDANDITGQTWMFKTILSAPNITVDPTITRVFPGQDAQFVVKFTSFSECVARWYIYVDGVNDIALTNSNGVVLNSAKYAVVNDKHTEAKLTVKESTFTDQGYYYCILVNTDDMTDQSAQAALAVKVLKAHWTLDALMGGKYPDETGNYPADPNGTPFFEPGVVGNGVRIDPLNGYASAGTWNPSEYSNQFTLSLWAKWAGQTNPTTWQGLISKEVSYGADTMMWQYEVVQSAQASSTVQLKNGLETGNLTTPVLPVDDWEHVVITWDGTTATIYRNGVQSASGAWQPGTKTDAPVNIGISAFSNSQNLMFNGALDDIRIYNYAFDKYDAADLYYAVSKIGVCIEATNYNAAYDFNKNCKVDLGDFAMLASEWLKCGRYPAESCND